MGGPGGGSGGPGGASDGPGGRFETPVSYSNDFLAYSCTVHRLYKVFISSPPPRGPPMGPEMVGGLGYLQEAYKKLIETYKSLTETYRKLQHPGRGGPGV